MRRPTPTELGYALLFSAPTGLGAAVFSANLVGPAPAVWAFGAGVTVAVFALVVALVVTGQTAAPDGEIR